MTTLRDLAVHVWEGELGTPYRWGGNDPMEGFDCSGLVIEGLKSVGLLPRNGDWSAEQLAREVFAAKPRCPPAPILPGCLVFFADSAQHIYHVEIVHSVIGGKVFTIGAAGGGSATTSIDAAEAQDAFVKIRPRETWTLCLDPFA